MKKSLYRQVMFVISSICLILLITIAVKIGVFSELTSCVWIESILSVINNSYFSGVLCSIIAVIVIYFFQVQYSKRMLKKDVRCNEIIQDVYDGIEKYCNISNTIPERTSKNEEKDYSKRQIADGLMYYKFYKEYEVDFEMMEKMLEDVNSWGNGKSCNSPDVYILSLHACFPELSYKEIAEKVWQKLKVNYTEDEIQKVIHTPLFVKRSEDLSVGNARIQAQEGCFFICADDEKGGLITLDSIPPVMVYRIPASYKAGIRDELDKEEKINVCSIYPEMPSGGAYLRAKYRTVRYDVSEKDYTVYDISQKTHCRRDTDLRIIVKEDLPIKWAKQIVRHVCEGYKSSSDVIWIYVGVSKEDMLLYNWRITGRWINPLWKNTGIDPLKERDGEFSWENQSGTSIISEYNEKNVYKPDDELYVYYHQIFEDSMPYIREMFSLYANDEKEKLYTWISENKEQIQEFYNKTTNGCCSRIREWNEFIKHYSLLYIELNNICLEIENRNWNPQAKWHLVGRKIHSIQKEKDVIEKGEVKWRKTPDVTDEELKKYKPCYENHRIRAFTQTIPVSEDAIEVRMEIKYEKNTEGKIIVSGKTNLFDGAQLLISITPDGKFYGPSCKVNCLNGTFTSVPLGNGTNLSGKCRLSITMPVSSVQPIEFVKKSGMQYENLKGDFIVRDGISPSGKYEQEVVL